jgi:hypothetical protein
VFQIKFNDKIFDVRVTTSGFKIKGSQHKYWRYIAEEHLRKFCIVLNNTRNIKMFVPITDRDVLSLPDYHNSVLHMSLLLRLMFPEKIIIDTETNTVKLNEKIDFTHKKFIQKRNKLLSSDNRIFIISDKKTQVTDKFQRSLTDFSLCSSIKNFKNETRNNQ